MPELRRDFEDRCAYSLRHTTQCGLQCMEVDHFNPTLGGKRRNQYRNLMWGTRICNNAKRDYWPTSEERKNGNRFLNPCEEWDYGMHIFEDPITHKLFGTTRSGRYHVEMLQLNNETFIWERETRAQLIQFLNRAQSVGIKPFEDILVELRKIKDQLERLIPSIPYGIQLHNPEP